jgi:hypothetical protein
MAYQVGDELVALDTVPGGFFLAGETVKVLEIPEDGVPIVGIAPTEEQPAGRSARMHDEYAEHFEPA